MIGKDRPEQNMNHPSSIRNELENRAWRNHAAFARRQLDKQAFRRRSGWRKLQWQDRALLILTATQLAWMFLLKAKQDFW